MQEDFHYYATYCAAVIAGYSHKESLDIAYSAQLVDHCSKTLLQKINAPLHAATTQLQLEMMNHPTDIIGLQEITRIWASFHFLPADLYSQCRPKSKLYKNKYHLICGPNGNLVKDTVELAKGRKLQAVGISMHVLADTWAHRNFVGTPSLVMNNVDSEIFEVLPEDNQKRRRLAFTHNVSSGDNIDKCRYVNTVFQADEKSIMNLGHGRAGHLPDYSFIHYQYMPAWADYEMVDKDNPKEYYNAFCQMVYAMQYLRGEKAGFELNTYAFEAVEPYKEKIDAILRKRQLIASQDWKKFGEELSGEKIEDFDLNKYLGEYTEAKENKDDTFIGKFIVSSLAQKSMVTNRIFNSKNLIAGYSIDFSKKGFKGVKDYIKIVEYLRGGDST